MGPSQTKPVRFRVRGNISADIQRNARGAGADLRRGVAEGQWFPLHVWTFGDIIVDESANLEAQEFIRKKIRQTVKDPEKAHKLCLTELYARRLLCDSGYYEQFNRDNVDIVDIKANPITEPTPVGIKTSDGTLYDLDVIICATGLDAVVGNYTRIAIKGRGGESLKEHWAEMGPTLYLGIMVPNFPNLFMIAGPNGPFSNLPPAIETQVEIISDLIAMAERQNSVNGSVEANGTNGASGVNANGHPNDGVKHGVIEAEREAEDKWTQRCEELSAASLFRKVDSWVFGKNIPGKKNAVMFYFGGLGPYRKEVAALVKDNMKGFRIS